MKTSFTLAMTVAAASAWTSNYQCSLVNLEDFTLGFLKGAIEAELPNVMDCIQDAETLVSDVEKAVADFKKENFDGVKNGIIEVGTIVRSISGDIKTCKEGITGIDNLIKMAESFKSPWSFAYHVAHDLLVNGVEIFHEVDSAISDYDASNFEGFGENIGKAMAQVAGSAAPRGARKK